MKHFVVYMMNKKIFLSGLFVALGALYALAGAEQACRHINNNLVSGAGDSLRKYLLEHDADQPSDEPFRASLKYLEQCVSVYSETRKFTLDIEYSVFYDTDEFDTPDDKRVGKIVRDKDNFYQKELGTLRILNADHELILNERNEYITIRDRQNEKIEPVQMDADSLSKFITHSEKTATGYIYYLDAGPLEKFEVIAQRDGSLGIWRNYYRNKMDFGAGEVRVVTQLTYRNFNKNPKIDPSVFSLSPYVLVNKKGEVTARETYKNYYILNQLQKL